MQSTFLHPTKKTKFLVGELTAMGALSFSGHVQTGNIESQPEFRKPVFQNAIKSLK
jgi:hypothetical protein